MFRTFIKIIIPMNNKNGHPAAVLQNCVMNKQLVTRA